MSDIQFPTNLTNTVLVANIYDTNGAYIDQVILSEVSTKLYVGDLPGTLSADTYVIIIFNGADVVGQQDVIWDGSNTLSRIQQLVDIKTLLTTIQTNMS